MVVVYNEMNDDVPIRKPPIVADTNPAIDTPPFVPFGTTFQVITETGSSQNTEPNSELSVSPSAQEMALNELTNSQEFQYFFCSEKSISISWVKNDSLNGQVNRWSLHSLPSQ